MGTACWTRFFAVNFAVGVATGIVMEFEFGTNWAAYSPFIGDVFGSALAAEGIFANSWQQTPAGYHIVWQDVQGEMMPRAEVTSFWGMVFNPSSVDRLTYTLIGALVLGAFFVASVCSYYLLKNRHQEVARCCLIRGFPSSLEGHYVPRISNVDYGRKSKILRPMEFALRTRGDGRR